MSDYIEPITEISQINEDECLAGYRGGFGSIPMDYTQKSARLRANTLQSVARSGGSFDF